MNEPARSLRDTDSGPITINAVAGTVWRIGWAPDPFAWTPWEYAELGHFDGRWDDPDGVYRTLYVGDSLLGAFLEVLARFRPDLALQAELDAIEDDAELDARYPTTRAGPVPRSWCEPRMVGSAALRGEFFDVRDIASIATLRRRFAHLAADLGLPGTG